MDFKQINKSLSQPWNKILGLDLSSQNLKYMLVRRKGRGIVVEGFGRYAIANGESDNQEKLSNALSALYRTGNGFKNAKAVLGVHDPRIIVKRERLPRMGKKEIDQTISFGIQNEAGGEAASPYICAYRILATDTGGETQDYLAMGAPDEWAEEKITIFTEAGITPSKMIPSLTALSNLIPYISEVREKRFVGFLDIGAKQSILVFFNQGNPEFFREISVGGDDFTKAVCGVIFHEGKSIQFTREEAMAFKLQYGYPLGFSEGRMYLGAPLEEIGAMMRPLVERVSGEVQRSMSFYKEELHGSDIESLYLLGGGANLKHLNEVMAEKIGIPVSLLPLPDDMEIEGSEKEQNIFQQRYIENAVSLSLTLESSFEGNLLPKRFQERYKQKNIQKILRYAALVIISVMTLISVNSMNRLSLLKAQVSSLESHVQALEKRRLFFVSLQGRKSVLEKEITRLSRQSEHDKNLVPVLRLITHTLPSQLGLFSIDFVRESEIDEKKKVSADTAKASQKVVKLKGISQAPPNDLGVYLAQFIMDLEKSGYFSSVTIKETETPGQKDYLFELLAYLKD